MFLMNIIPVAVGAAIAVLLIIVIWFVSVRNKFVRMEQDIESSVSRIDVYLTKRYDLLTKMLAATKGFAKHESELLVKVTEMRNPSSAQSLSEKSAINAEMDEVAKSINVAVEAYPDLKSDKVFVKLQSAISEVEENLQAARSNYNSNVSVFNKAILVFPNSIVAGSKFTKKDYFEAEAAKREDVKIEF